MPPRGTTWKPRWLCCLGPNRRRIVRLGGRGRGAGKNVLLEGLEDGWVSGSRGTWALCGGIWLGRMIDSADE